ncbi:unnamed protein product [Protopolystoma xenopodis]|uniref:Uncharacterized protein n=1 Tax=Protopolystoma xenopodis TaxID=117903 RepID=A0A3S5BFD9_9PLAT|nr:unnamed protein product [Protopolystoma xenopodis]
MTSIDCISVFMAPRADLFPRLLAPSERWLSISRFGEFHPSRLPVLSSSARRHLRLRLAADLCLDAPANFELPKSSKMFKTLRVCQDWDNRKVEKEELQRDNIVEDTEEEDERNEEVSSFDYKIPSCTDMECCGNFGEETLHNIPLDSSSVDEVQKKRLYKAGISQRQTSFEPLGRFQVGPRWLSKFNKLTNFRSGLTSS